MSQPTDVEPSSTGLRASAGEAVLLRRSATVVVALSLLPAILGWFGVDLGSASPDMSGSAADDVEAALRLVSGAFTHTILEWTAFSAALVTAALALGHYAIRKDVIPPVVATALFWAGTTDAFHVLVADRLIEANADNVDLIPFTWAISRLFSAVVPLTAVLILAARASRPERRRSKATFVAATSVLFGAAACLAVYLSATSDSLPRTTYPDALITRPGDIAPLVVFLAAGLFVYPRFHRRTRSLFSFSLLLSVVPHIAVQLHMAFGSTALFDHHFNAAHALKALAYATPCAGLILDFLGTHRAQQRSVVLLATLPDLVFRVGEDGKYLEYMGDPTSADLQVSPETFLGRTLNEMLPPAVAMPAMAALATALETGEVQLFEYVLPVAAGMLSFEARIAPLPDREVFVVAREITERVQAQEALAERAAHSAREARWDRIEIELTRVFDAHRHVGELLTEALAVLARSHDLSFASAWLIDEEGASLVPVDSWNGPPQFEREFGIGEGVVGSVAQSGERRILGGEELVPVIPPEIAVEVTVLPLVAGKETIGVLLLAGVQPIDVGRRGSVERSAERIALSVYHLLQVDRMRRLALQLSERGLEVDRKNVELERASRMKSEFLANISHELRTPLNAIIGFSEALKDDLVGELTEAQTDYVTEVHTAGNHLLSLINDILDLSKIEAGKLELHLEALDAEATTANALTVLRERAAAQQVEISRTIEGDVGRFYADARKVKQIVYNLLSNAVKFTEPGGTVRLELRRVEEGRVLEIAVTDTGIGIALADQAQLFQPFQQLDTSLSRKHQGTGLGLALVRQLTELHGGTVSLESEVDVGSRFAVRIPYREG